ncbi:MAG TPA: hypothetical protein VN397_05230 [Candidatus Methylomirabilis sp.]|nr:hypothetical protein [Candidatus Methylomirabilis sp.]
MSHRGKKASLYHSQRPSAHDVLRAEGHDSDIPPPSFRGTRPHVATDTAADPRSDVRSEEVVKPHNLN